VALVSVRPANEALAEEHEALVDVGDTGLLGLDRKPDRRDPLAEHREQLFGLLTGPLDADNKVIGVPDEPVGREAAPSQDLAVARVPVHLTPVALIEAVQRRQGDVRQQRRDDPALRGARDGPLEAARFPHHSSLQERAHQGEHALVRDTASHLAQDLGMREPVEGRHDTLPTSTGSRSGCGSCERVIHCRAAPSR
jgi:hypothetical protein